MCTDSIKCAVTDSIKRTKLNCSSLQKKVTETELADEITVVFNEYSHTSLYIIVELSASVAHVEQRSSHHVNGNSIPAAEPKSASIA